MSEQRPHARMVQALVAQQPNSVVQRHRRTCGTEETILYQAAVRPFGDLGEPYSTPTTRPRLHGDNRRGATPPPA